MNILFGTGKQNIGSKVMNLANAGDTIKASLLTMTTQTGHVYLVTSATNATPIVLGLSSTTGMTAGDILVVGGVGGNTAANGTWTAGTVVANTSVQLLTRRDSNNSTGNGSYTSGGYIVDITAATTISDLGGNGGSNGNGTDVSITGQSIAAFGVWNASSWTWTGLSATKSYAIALYDSSASNDLIAWIDGMCQVYVVTTAGSSSTAIAVERLANYIANGTTIVFSNGASATLSSQAATGNTSLAVTSTAASIAAASQADVLTYNNTVGATAGLPVTPGAGGSMTFTPDTGANKIFVL